MQRSDLRHWAAHLTGGYETKRFLLFRIPARLCGFLPYSPAFRLAFLLLKNTISSFWYYKNTSPHRLCQNDTDKAILNVFCSASPIQFLLFEGQSLSRCYSNLDCSHWCSKIFHKGFHQGMLCISKYTESVLHLWNFHIWGTHAFQSCDPRFLQTLNRHHNTSICCWWIQKKKTSYFSQPVLIQYLLK